MKNELIEDGTKLHEANIIIPLKKTGLFQDLKKRIVAVKKSEGTE